MKKHKKRGPKGPGPIGLSQRKLLEKACLICNKPCRYWLPYKINYRMKRVLDSLIKRGLLVEVNTLLSPTYEPTVAGRQEIQNANR